MFKKNKYYNFEIGENISLETDKYISKISAENEELKHQLANTKHKLESLSNQLQDTKLAPAISNECGKCKYVVRSIWDNRIIGCNKNMVCDDYVKENTND